jgi:predicted phage tail protein
VLLDDAYAYTVTAVDGAGNESVASDPLPLVVDRTAPPRPTSLVLTGAAASPDRPSLAWNSGGPDALSGFDHYAVYRGSLLVGTPTTPAFTDAALAVNGSYVYTVKAVDAAGNASVASTSATAIWDTSPPTLPTSLTIPSPTPRPALAFTASTDAGGSGVDHYVVYRDGAALGTSLTPAYGDADGALVEGPHTYAVQAVDGAGNTSPVTDAVTVAVDRTPPTVVPGLAGASPVMRPVVTWSAADDPGANASGINRYEVYRGSTLIGETSGLTFQDDAVNLDGDYLYTVRALDRAGNLGPAQGSGVVVRFDRTPPPAPTRLTAPSPTPDVPRLAWTSGGSDNLSGFAVYEIYRDGTLAGQSAQPTFADTGLSQQGPHSYVVRTIDAAGNSSAPSTTLTVVYDATAPPTPTGLTIASPTNLPQLSWDAGADDDTGASGIDHYDVYRDGTVVGRSTTTTFADSSVLSNGSYAYGITAVDRAGNESLASRTVIIRYDGTAPPAPADVSGVSPTRVPVLTWRGVSDAATGGSPVQTYRIYRDGAFVGETTGTSFTDPGVGASGHHLYTVRALDLAGNLGAASLTRDIVVDLLGPQLDDIAVPATRIMGQAVAFSVVPHDQFAALRGPAHWDFGDGSATGNNVTHVYGAPGRYAITISAADVLGNQTVVANRAITIEAPPGGIPPSYLKLSTIGNVRRSTLKRARGRIYFLVNVDRSSELELVLEKEGAVVSDVVRRVPSGGARLFVTMPKAEWAPGRVRLTARSVSGGKSAARRFKIIR